MEGQQVKWTTTTMETAQWFVFMLASSVALPIVIGAIFDMSLIEISGLMQRSFFIIGIASVLQGLFGHRLPIMEGPAGIWISIFSVMALTSSQRGETLKETLQVLEAIMILTGIFLFIFGVFKLAQKILPVFTPLVTGTFFFLLTVQLSGIFLKGMLGLQQGSESIQLIDSLLAFMTFIIVLGLSIFAKGWLRNYGVLIGIMVGWISFVLVKDGAKSDATVPIVSFPEWFAFGMPQFDISIIPIAFVTSIVLLSNLVASVVAVSQSIYDKPRYNQQQINRGSIFSGINHGLTGMFSALANVPLATPAGFIKLTGQKRKMPFIYASLVLIGIAFFPPIVSFISTIPAPIANATLMATFVQLVGLAINNVTIEPLDSRKVTIVGVSYLFGISTMFLPVEVFSELPAVVQNLASNGLLIGTALVITLEQLWKVDESSSR